MVSRKHRGFAKKRSVVPIMSLIQSYLKLQDAIQLAGKGNGYKIDYNCPPIFRFEYPWLTQMDLWELRDLKTIVIDGVHTCKTNDPNTIMKFAEPAPFGKGSETVYDDTVRCALQIPAQRLNFQELNHFFTDKLSHCLGILARRGSALTPRLYKLHIYKEGGMFKPHRDTIHDPNHVATMVVQLPSAFTGGQLVLHHNGVRVETEGNVFMFYTDVEHEVLPVTSGVRMVLQFDLYDESDPLSDDEKSIDTVKSEDGGGDPVDFGSRYYTSREQVCDHETIKAAVAGWFERHKHKHLGFLLNHAYGRHLLTPDVLKASDHDLYEAVTNAGYRCELVTTLVYHMDGVEEHEVYAMPFDPTTGEHRMDWDMHLYTIRGIIGGDTLAEQRSCEYTGNEAMNGFGAYASAMLIVHHP